ncbi:MAG: adenylate kinase [Candidatus Zixiibacteriota bacterium]
MRWILLGPPGSGKGTQAKKLAAAHKVVHLSTGELLRGEIAGGSELGKTAKSYMDRGDLVPDELILRMIHDHLPSDGDGGGFILDGFPRTENQAQALDEMLAKEGRPIDRVVLIRVGEAEIKRRLEGRAAVEGRTDDSAAVIQRRLDVYQEQTKPVAEYYRRQGMLTEIDGEKPIDQVYDDLNVLVKQ